MAAQTAGLWETAGWVGVEEAIEEMTPIENGDLDPETVAEL